MAFGSLHRATLWPLGIDDKGEHFNHNWYNTLINHRFEFSEDCGDFLKKIRCFARNILDNEVKLFYYRAKQCRSVLIKSMLIMFI